MKIELYNLLIENHLYTHSIGLVNDKQTFEKLNSIFRLGGLYSKESLRKMGLNVRGKVSGHIRFTKENYVSVFDPTLHSYKKKLLSDKSHHFAHFSNTDIVFMIDEEVELLDEAQRNEFDSSEIIVKNMIPISLVRGIILPNVNLVVKAVRKMLLKYGLEIPLYGYDGFEIESGYNKTAHKK